MSVPGASNPLLLSSAGGAAALEIERSLRFSRGDSAYLNRTFSSGNRTTWTWSGWVKKALDGENQTLFGHFNATNGMFIRFTSGSLLEIQNISSAGNTLLQSAAIYRDPGAWMHVVAVWDTSNSTADDRHRLYVNGVKLETFTNRTNPSPSQNGDINDAVEHRIGDWVDSTNNHFDGYLADVHFIDGQALAATDFGEFDATTGAWNPIVYSGSHGTTGFHLDFSDNSSASALGTDSSGNGNDWTVNNISINNSLLNYTYGLSYVGYSGGTTITNPSNGFNGNIADRFEGETASGAAQTAIYTWVPPGGSISATSLKIRLQYFGVQSFATISVAVNGGSYYNTGGGTTITTYDFSSLITGNQVTEVKLKWEANGSGIGSPGWYAVYINDQILIDGSGGTDSVFDSPTNGTQTDTGAGGEVSGNYCTWNSAAKGADATLTNGNLDIAYGTSTTRNAQQGTFGMSYGKWYWEIAITASNLSLAPSLIGIADSADPSTVGSFPGINSRGWGYYGGSGQVYHSNTPTSYGDTYNVNDVIGVAFDADNGNLYYYKNGTVQNSGTAAFTGLTTGPYFPSIADDGPTSTFGATANFGQRAFVYQNVGVDRPSADFKALCTANFNTPTIKDPSTYMDVITYDGNGSSLTLPNANSTPTSLAFDPDFVWIKQRAAPKRDNNVYDTVRGATKLLSTNGTGADASTYDVYVGQGAEQTVSGLTSFDTGSKTFTVGSSNVANSSSVSYVGWCWDAGTSTASNTDGTITSQVRANISAGFSVLTYTGTGVNATIGHGLGVAPQFIVIKDRDGTTDWMVYHESLGNSAYLNLNLRDAAQTSAPWWQNTSPTPSVFYIGTSIYLNSSGNGYVAYCWAPMEGYSAFGSYTGNGSADGPFAYTGFKPRWLMIKNASSNGTNWVMHDTSINPENYAYRQLFANLANQENGTYGYPFLDILSNGFKLRSTYGDYNTVSETYVYAAFAESPFAYARAR